MMTRLTAWHRYALLDAREARGLVWLDDVKLWARRDQVEAYLPGDAVAGYRDGFIADLVEAGHLAIRVAHGARIAHPIARAREAA